MARICQEYKKWVEEEVETPIDEWVEVTEKKCKKRKWYDPRRWFCWLVTTLVKITRWIITIIGKWVVYTVCRVISALVTFGLTILNIIWWVVKWGYCIMWGRGDREKLPMRTLQVEVIIVDKDDNTKNPITNEELDNRIADADRILRKEARITVKRRGNITHTISSSLYELDVSSPGDTFSEWIKGFVLLSGRDSPRYLTIYAIGHIKGAEALHQPLYGSVFTVAGNPDTSLCHEIGHALLGVLNSYHSPNKGYLMYVPWDKRQKYCGWPKGVPKLSKNERCTMRRSRWVDWSWAPVP